MRAVGVDRHARGVGVHFCMEATGPYSEAPATHPADAGRPVSVVNPTRVRYAALAWGRANKTDRADARPIAEYAARERPAAWQPPSSEVRELQALVRRIDDLVEMAALEEGRLSSPALATCVRKSVERTVRLLEKEVAKLRGAADELTASTPAVSADRELLESIPGVGRQTATVIPAELPAVERLPSAETAAAYCGLSPRGSSGAAPACGGGPGCRRPATPGRARRCSCRRRRRSGSTRRSGNSSRG